MLSLFFQSLFIFSIMDYFLVEYMNLSGVYFLLHFVHNMIVSYLTYPNIEAIFCKDCGTKNFDERVLPYVYSLHVYHVLSYFHYLNANDWLHHFFSMFVAVPLTAFFFREEMQFLGMCLFFTTGLPGGINYLLCFLYKNRWMITKREQLCINVFIQSWIRCPGIVMTSGFVLQHVLQNKELFTKECCIGGIIFFILYWNGIYFQNEVFRAHYSLRT